MLRLFLDHFFAYEWPFYRFEESININISLNAAQLVHYGNFPYSQLTDFLWLKDLCCLSDSVLFLRKICSCCMLINVRDMLSLKNIIWDRIANRTLTNSCLLFFYQWITKVAIVYRKINKSRNWMCWHSSSPCPFEFLRLVLSSEV